MTLIGVALTLVFGVPATFAWYKAGDFALSGIIGEFTGIGGDVSTSVGWLIIFSVLSVLTMAAIMLFVWGFCWMLWIIFRSEQANKIYSSTYQSGKNVVEKSDVYRQKVFSEENKAKASQVTQTSKTKAVELSKTSMTKAGELTKTSQSKISEFNEKRRQRRIEKGSK
jgi:hypothetical protein